jgi:hypothetical protein
MQEPDMRVDPRHHFAIEFEHQAQHAVRSRMLRPEIDREVTQVLRLLIHDQAFGSAFAFSSPGSG